MSTTRHYIIYTKNLFLTRRVNLIDCPGVVSNTADSNSDMLCKVRDTQSISPFELITLAQPNSTRHFCHDLELHGGDLISSPVDSI